MKSNEFFGWPKTTDPLLVIKHMNFHKEDSARKMKNKITRRMTIFTNKRKSVKEKNSSSSLSRFNKSYSRSLTNNSKSDNTTSNDYKMKEKLREKPREINLTLGSNTVKTQSNIQTQRGTSQPLLKFGMYLKIK